MIPPHPKIARMGFPFFSLPLVDLDVTSLLALSPKQNKGQTRPV